jgi:4'-phosphopantetheinyl transferase
LLNTVEIKIATLSNIKLEGGAFYVLCNAGIIKKTGLSALAHQLLSAHEQALFQQRKSLMAKKEYLTSRFLIKSLLSKQLRLPYQEIQLSFNNQSQKLEAIYHHQPLAVNISLAHSKGMVFFAICDAKTAIGVDIEYQNINRNILPLAEEFFHPKEFKALSKNSHLKFYQLWTLKESLAKAKGLSVLELLGQDTLKLLKTFQYTFSQYDNFQLAAIHNREFSSMPCYLVDLEKSLENHHE